MKIALISDTHFGDPKGTLIARDESGKNLIPGSKYDAFANAAGKNNDYLILLGDILDFAVTSYHEAYEIAKAFFLQIQKDGIAGELIYVPGNHDADIWHIVEHEVNIIHQMLNGRIPRQFRMSVPGVIDDRSKSNHPGFTLPGVTQHTVPGEPKYARLFLDKITTKEGSRSWFNFAYPNIYMVTDAESVLITHGHYLESYWSLASVWALRVFGKKSLGISGALDMKNLVGMNFPLNQLACSGVGQAKPLTDVLYDIQCEVKAGKLEHTRKYVERLDDQLDKHVFDYSGLDPREWGSDFLSNKLKRKMLKMLEEVEDTRYSQEFIHKKEVLRRFKDYYNASCVEIRQLRDTENYDIPLPSYVIFGHTHQPIPWGANDAPKTRTSSGQLLRLFNSGGWLERETNGRRDFCGAEVFTYSTEEGFNSIPIR
jgi:predicted phosphodiesterase